VQKGSRRISLFDVIAVIGICAVVGAVLFPVVAQARSASRKASGLASYRAASLAHSMYTTDYDDDDLEPDGIHHGRGKGLTGGGGGTNTGIV